MKIKHLPLILAVAFMSNAFANNSHAPKQLKVPFINQSVNSTDYAGLQISYKMESNVLQQVVCSLSHFYKGWMEYSINGQVQESGVYGDSHTLVLTSKGPTSYISEQLDQLHADAEGTATIHDNGHSGVQSYVSCFYMPDENK